MLTRSKHHAAQNKLDHVDRITLSQQPFRSTTKNFANTVTPDGHVTHYTRKRPTSSSSNTTRRGARVTARTRKHVTRHVHERKCPRREQLNVDTSDELRTAEKQCPTSDSRTCFGHQLRMSRNGSFPIDIIRNGGQETSMRTTAQNHKT